MLSRMLQHMRKEMNVFLSKSRYFSDRHIIMRSFYNLDEINQYGSGHACQPIGLYVPT
jgi:hypothetical protein